MRLDPNRSGAALDLAFFFDGIELHQILGWIP